MDEHHIAVPRSARYHTLGNAPSAGSIWIVLHGYGQLARYFLRKFEGLEEGRYIVAPEGLSRFYLDEGHTRVGATWMTREDRECEIVDQISYLDRLALHARSHAGGKATLAVLGFSQGVATASRWAVQGHTSIDRLVFWGGTLPPDVEVADLAAHPGSTRVDLVLGENDTVVQPTAVVQSAARLRAAGVPHALHTFEGGHDLDTITLERLMNG